MTPFQHAVVALLWEAGYDTADIAFALHIPESEIWNALSGIREGSGGSADEPA